MITFAYNGKIGIYDNLTHTVEYDGETFEYSNVPREMKIQIENASC
jgi:hypothetical protein